MKKSLLLFTAIMASMSLFAQTFYISPVTGDTMKLHPYHAVITPPVVIPPVVDFGTLN